MDSHELLVLRCSMIQEAVVASICTDGVECTGVCAFSGASFVLVGVDSTWSGTGVLSPAPREAVSSQV